jgi:hypothetical protein
LKLPINDQPAKAARQEKLWSVAAAMEQARQRVWHPKPATDKQPQDNKADFPQLKCQVVLSPAKREAWQDQDSRFV